MENYRDKGKSEISTKKRRKKRTKKKKCHSMLNIDCKKKKKNVQEADAPSLLKM